ncbi:hypothetical protein TeGR_g12772, partial [Tetraparma gracilis]
SAKLFVTSKLIGSALRGFYSKLGGEGFSPGAEFSAAADAAREVGATVVLGDRDVDVTLRRLAEAAQRTDFSKVSFEDLDAASASVLGVGDPTSVTSAELSAMVERMKERGNTDKLMAAVEAALPELYGALVGERDEYMGRGLDELGAGRAVAVVGVAHLRGIVEYLEGRGWKQQGGCV